jgi:hypothetical protein
MKWSWNSLTVGGDPTVPQIGPVDATIASCNCRLFGEPHWDVAFALRGGNAQWNQRAWLDGEQRVDLEIRGISPGSTTVFVTGFVGPPSPTTGSIDVIDNSIYQQNFFRVSVIP